MFKEVAVDPAAVASSLLHFNQVVDRFGIPEGRLIAAFPSKWKRAAFAAVKAAGLSHREEKRIEMRLDKVPRCTFMARQRPGEGCHADWIAAAKHEHLRLPFDAIVALRPVDVDGFLVPEELSIEHPVFAPNRQWRVPRKSVEMAKCARPVLAQSTHVKLIDPHFKPDRRKFSAPFLAFMLCLRTDTAVAVDVYVSEETHALLGRDAEFLWTMLLRQRPELKGSIRVFTRPKAEMHNRFVLGNEGGVSFQTGLDEDTGGDRPTDIVSVLQEDVFQQEWALHEGGDAVFSMDF